MSKGRKFFINILYVFPQIYAVVFFWFLVLELFLRREFHKVCFDEVINLTVHNTVYV